jgi:hypothetical protein
MMYKPTRSYAPTPNTGPMPVRPVMPQQPMQAMGQPMQQPGILSLLRPQMGGGRIEPRGPIRNY